MPDSQKRQALRVLVAPDSFKGCLEAAEVAARIASGIRAAIPRSLVTEAPIADGGEGTASAIARGLGGAWHHVTVLDANRNSIQLPFAVCKSAELGAFAVFDVAEIIGLPDVVLPAGVRTTKGIGQAVRAIAKQGFKTIALGLGGSSTNDGGAGMLAELAFEFLDATGAAIDPVFDNLAQVHSIEWRVDSGWLTDIRLIGLTDVASPLAGPTGASMIFGGQKGFRDLEQADAVLAQFGKQCSAMLGRDLSCIEGAGAAGGL